MKLVRSTLVAVLATVVVAPVAARAQPAPQQPHMQRAWEGLDQARRELEVATHDKAGHRAKALDLVHQAMNEVKQGMAAGAMDIERRERQQYQQHHH